MKTALIVILFCFCSCKEAPAELSQQSNKQSGIVEAWQKDSLGCEKIRSKAMAEEIITKCKLENSTESELINILGKPNKINYNGNDKVLMYYFDSACYNEQVIEDSDYCTAEFTFIENRLYRRDYICI